MPSAVRMCVLLCLLVAACSEPVASSATTDDVGAAGTDTSGGVDDGVSPDALAGDVGPVGVDAQAGTTDSGAATVSFAQMCARLSQRICAPMAACCKGMALRFSSTADCEAKMTSACLDNGTAEAKAVAAGQATISAASLAQCEALSESSAAACALPVQSQQLEVCGAIVSDVAKGGEACASGKGGMRCASGKGVCFPEPTKTDCKIYAAAGTPCSAAPCKPGHHCIASSDGSPALCDAPRDVGGGCKADVHCAEGLACVDNKCTPGLGQGVACKGSSKCGAGLWCDAATEKCAPRLGPGVKCYSQMACAGALTCHGVGTGLVCVPAGPDEGKDDPGLPGFLESCVQDCQKGLACKMGPLPGTCVPGLCAAMGQK